MTPNEIFNLSNDEIFAELKALNLTCGPVTDTTRNLYENRLMKHYKKDNMQKIPHPAAFIKTPSKKTINQCNKYTSPEPSPDIVSPIRVEVSRIYFNMVIYNLNFTE